jgi:hypothetical protein
MATRNQSDAIRQPLSGTWQQISGSFNFSYTSIAGFPRLLLHHDGSLYVLADTGAILWLKPEYQVDGGVWTDSGWGPDGGKFTFPAGWDGTISLHCNRPCFPTDYPAGTVINTRVMAKCSGSVVLCDSLLDPYPDVSKTWTQSDSYQWNDAEDDVVIPLWGPIPDTGQTVQYAVGDDADYGWDVDENSDADGHAGLKYTQLGVGYVKDERTGLTYYFGDSSTITWDAAMAAAAGFSGMGLSWRLPTIKEMVWLFDYSKTGGTLDPLVSSLTTGFPWTSTENASNNSLVWTASIAVGSTDYSINKTAFLRPVIYVSGQPLSASLSDNGDETITDSNTGFMWTKYLLGGDGIIPPDQVNWASAVANALACSVGGYSDWRLPNAKELQTIVKYDVSPTGNPAIDTAFFPQIPSGAKIWTSTTKAGAASSAWSVWMQDSGFLYHIPKTESVGYYAIAMRNI